MSQGVYGGVADQMNKLVVNDGLMQHIGVGMWLYGEAQGFSPHIQWDLTLPDSKWNGT